MRTFLRILYFTPGKGRIKERDKKIKSNTLHHQNGPRRAMRAVGGGGVGGGLTESIHCSQSQKELDEEIGRLVEHQEENVNEENVSTAGKSKEKKSQHWIIQ